jgi:hypothetical protein
MSQVVEGVRAALIIHDKSASVDFAYCIWCSLSSVSMCLVLGVSLKKGLNIIFCVNLKIRLAIGKG